MAVQEDWQDVTRCSARQLNRLDRAMSLNKDMRPCCSRVNDPVCKSISKKMTRGQFKLASSQTGFANCKVPVPLSLPSEWLWQKNALVKQMSNMSSNTRKDGKRISRISLPVNASVVVVVSSDLLERLRHKGSAKTLPFPLAILITTERDRERPEWAESDVWFNYCSYIMNYYYNCHCYYDNSPEWGSLTLPLTSQNHASPVIGHTAVAVKCNLAPGGIANLAHLNGPHGRLC